VIESAAALIQVEITAIDNSIVELHASRLGWPAEGDSSSYSSAEYMAVRVTPDLLNLDSTFGEDLTRNIGNCNPAS
jgi:hypothetical protein